MSGLFGGKKTQSTTPQRLNAIQINQSAYGNAIPICYGTNRVPITLIDYVDFQAVPQTQSGGGKGGGGSTTTGYQYSASIVGMLCEGPITSVNAVYKDKAQTTLSAENMVLFNGTAAQAPWQYMQSNHPDHALPYDHTAYIAAANYALGSSAGLPNLSFEITGLLPFLVNGVVDAEPSAIITDYCTDPHHGVGFPFLASFSGPNGYQQYCISMGFFISPTETTQRQAQDFINEILRITNSQAVWTAGVGLRMVPYQDQAVSGNGASYTPDLTPVYTFTDSDYIFDEGQEPVTRSIVPANETFNTWRVEYLNRANQYNTAIEEFRDELDIALNGVRVAPTVNLHGITQQSVAKTVAALLGLRNLNIRSTFKFKVRMDFSLLEPMDLVAINDSTAGIVNQLVRIIETADDENDVFTITAEEMMVGPASAPQYDTQLMAGYAANYAAVPGPVATPYIFTMPPLLADPSTGGYEIGVAVAGSTGLWGGCDVWASLDNIAYDHIGQIFGPARVGTSLGAIQAISDPDTSSILSVQLNQSYPMVINSGSRADADNLRTLFILDGEVMSYQTSQALGDNAFALSYLRRRQYQSQNVAHAAGSQFAILDKAIFRWPFDPGYSGQPFWLKFVSFNIFGGGHETLASVTAYQGTFQAQNGGQLLPAGATPLVARGNCVNVGTRIFKSGGVAAWDSDCYSVDAFASGCVLKFRSCQSKSSVMLGLSTSPTTDSSYASINHAWFAAVDGSAQIQEKGVFILSAGQYTTNSVFEIRYDGKFVRYYLSGVLFREVPDPGRVFFLDSSFYSPGAAVDNVYFGPLSTIASSRFIARGNCTVGNENAQKSGGVLGWDSDIYSIEGFPNCHVVFKPNTNSEAFMVGLGTKPAQDTSYTSINYAWYCYSDGNAYIYESGVLIGGIAAYGVSTVLAITYDGTTVTYLMNGRSVRTVASPGLTLFADSSFYAPGTGCNSLQFGPTTQLELKDTSQLGLNSVTDSPVTIAPADGSQTYASATQPVIEVPGLNASASYTSPAQTDTQVTVAWSGQARISNTTSGTAVGEARISVTVYVNGVQVFSKYLTLESYTGGSTDWGFFAGSLPFSVPAGQTVTAYFQTGRSFSTSGTSPAQTMYWRSAILNMTGVKR